MKMFRMVVGSIAIVLGVLGAESPAFAGKGQCYSASGKPIGGRYNTDRPDYGFIQSVIRSGGSCTGVSPSYGQDYSDPGYYRYGYEYERPYYRPYYRPY